MGSDMAMASKPYDLVPPDGIVLGTTPANNGRDSIVSLDRSDQAHHATMWGRTGTGKSKLIQALFLQHLAKGNGVCLIDPHHDLSFDILSYLVTDHFFKRPGAFRRLIYLDWGNGAVIPFNVLGDQQSPQTTALHALEAMIRVWPELR